MKSLKSLVISVLAFTAIAASASVIGKVDTDFNWIGKNPYVQVESISDPEVKGVTCHLSSAKAGGLGEAVGLSTDVSRFSLACRQTDQLIIPSGIKQQKEITTFSRNPFFKELRVTRMYDEVNKTIIYLVTSKGLINGSAFNAISTIPLAPWGVKEPIIK